MANMIFFHVPHASVLIPDEYKNQFLLSSESLDYEAHLMADLFMDKLVEHFDEPKLIFPISRIVCDVERFRNDADEIMAAYGMGVVYFSSHDLQPLRKADMDVELIKSTLYDKHHARFKKEVASLLSKYGACFIIDLHAYAHKPLPYELHKDAPRPDICLGFEDFHMDKSLLASIEKLCGDVGYSVAINTPFSGAIVPLDFYQKDARVKSLMIEINKRTYLDGFDLNKEKFAQLQGLLHKIVGVISDYF